METMNVGIRRHLAPYTYESVQEDVIKEMNDGSLTEDSDEKKS